MILRHAKIFGTEEWAVRMNYVDVPANADGCDGVRAEVFESVDGASNPRPEMRRNNRVVTVRYWAMVGQTSVSALPDGKAVVFNPVLGQTTTQVNTPKGMSTTRDIAIGAAHDRLCAMLDEEAIAMGRSPYYMQPGAVYSLPGK